MKKKTTTVPPLSEAARIARNRYYAELRRKNPAAAQARQNAYWERVAQRYALEDARAAAQEQNGGTQHD